MRLSIPDCEETSGSEIAKLVGLELTQQFTLLPASSPASADIEAALQCRAARAHIHVRDRAVEQPLQLDLDLADARPEARARLVALAMAELIATSRLEHAPRTAPPAGASHEKPTKPYTLWLGAGAARAFSPASWAPLLNLGASRALGPWSLAAELQVELGSSSVPNADVSTRALSLALAAGWRALTSWLELTAALGVRAGHVQLSAAAASPDELAGRDLSGFFVTALGRVSLQLPLAGAWALRAHGEVGYVLVPVRGTGLDGAALLSLRGVTLSCGLALAFSL